MNAPPVIPSDTHTINVSSSVTQYITNETPEHCRAAFDVVFRSLGGLQDEVDRNDASRILRDAETAARVASNEAQYTLDAERADRRTCDLEHQSADAQLELRATGRLVERFQQGLERNNNRLEGYRESTEANTQHIEGINGSTQSNTRLIQAVEESTAGNTESIEAIRNNTESNTQRIEGVEGSIQEHTQSIETIRNSTRSSTQRMDGIEGSIQENMQSVEGNTLNIGTNTGRIEGNAQNIARNAEDIGRIQQHNAGMERTLNDHGNLYTAHDSSIRHLQQRTRGLNSSLRSLARDQRRRQLPAVILDQPTLADVTMSSEPVEHASGGSMHPGMAGPQSQDYRGWFAAFEDFAQASERGQNERLQAINNQYANLLTLLGGVEIALRGRWEQHGSRQANAVSVEQATTSATNDRDPTQQELGNCMRELHQIGSGLLNASAGTNDHARELAEIRGKIVALLREHPRISAYILAMLAAPADANRGSGLSEEIARVSLGVQQDVPYSRPTPADADASAPNQPRPHAQARSASSDGDDHPLDPQHRSRTGSLSPSEQYLTPNSPPPTPARDRKGKRRASPEPGDGRGAKRNKVSTSAAPRPRNPPLPGFKRCDGGWRHAWCPELEPLEPGESERTPWSCGEHPPRIGPIHRRYGV
ncbi:MAG: hypothetical protein LQ346_004638 [Caloplaca aetnensis]|nr:MAG: hypothetical protein LQ346_004638 [Caloplaca aetnensis]